MARVHELAREFGVTSSDVIARLESLGVEGKSPASGVDDALADRLRVEFNGSPPVQAPAEAAPEEAPAPVPEEPSSREPRRRWWRHLTELPMLVLFALVIAVIIKSFLIQAFYIPSGSMFPTLHIGDRVLVEKVSYRLHDPRRGDVVVFAREVFGPAPDVPWHQDVRNFLRELLGMQTGSGEEDYIKRVVAVGGDAIRYTGTPRTLYVNGEPFEEPYIRGGKDTASSTLTNADCRRLEMASSEDGCVVPAGEVFVMGDNRANSQDSRSIGPVEVDKVVGRAFVIIWPPGDVGWL